MQGITMATAENFESEVLASERPVAVEFFTEGCKPCERLRSVLMDFTGQLKIVGCDIDINGDLAEQWGVMNIPTLLFFKDGQMVGRVIGTVNDISEAEVAALCRQVLAVAAS